ncbi:MAG TPA: hypothetical protein VGP57_15500 [Actinoplanes sp.]|nr:hypothetical protein [Actinoplanes sp.]
MNNSTALVTGANKGIGKEIARQLAAGAVRLALLPDDGPTGEFHSWEGTVMPW